MYYCLVGGIGLILCIITYLLGLSHGKKAERELKTSQSKLLSDEISKQNEEINQNQHQLKVLHESVNKMEYLRLQKERASDDETGILIKRRTEKLKTAEQSYQQQFDQLKKQCEVLQKESESLEKDFLQKKNLFNTELKHLEKLEADKKHAIQSIIDSSLACTPFLAKQFADCFYIMDLEDANYLENKPRPAFTAAEKVRQISQQKRVLQEQCKLQEYQLNLYENAFPWLSDFKEISTEDLIQLSNAEDNPSDEYSTLRNWLSPQEYESLPTSERLQLALERYSNRKKTNWQIGIEYERYVGYCYEKKGYKVRYFGATEGLEDMGRDLLVSHDKKMFVIQCKRWAADKTIHEKHIFQLYGTTVLQKMENPGKDVYGLFVTTTTLSELAKSCADYLHITVVENFQLKPYPLIKCNVSKGGEKIYHLPFDQQYDRVIINPDDGDRYAETVQEAESNGFRHAWKWSGS